MALVEANGSMAVYGVAGMNLRGDLTWEQRQLFLKGELCVCGATRPTWPITIGGRVQFRCCVPNRGGTGLPKQSCLAMALVYVELNGICRGCGEGEVHGNRWEAQKLCRECLDALARGRSTGAKTKRWRVSPGDCLPSAGANAWDGHQAARALAKALCGRGAVVSESDGAPTLVGGHTERSVYKSPCVELTADQAAAAAEFLQLLDAMVTEVERRTREQGRSLLSGLASGQLSIDEFNEEQTRSSKGHG